jgi:hypothetical protein
VLFHRDARAARLTEAGDQLLPHARAAIAAVDRPGTRSRHCTGCCAGTSGSGSSVRRWTGVDFSPDDRSRLTVSTEAAEVQGRSCSTAGRASAPLPCARPEGHGAILAPEPWFDFREGEDRA